MGQYQYGKSKAKGAKAESSFDIACEKYGLKKIRNATRDENRLEHWDKLIQWDERECRFEVKASKRFNRYQKVQFDYFLLELHGVDKPENGGWIYDSKAEFIAFEMQDWFACFKLEDIKRFVYEKIGVIGPNDQKIKDAILSPTYKASPHFPNIQPYTIYHRLNKDGEYLQDAYIWVPRIDLIHWSDYYFEIHK